MSADDEPKKAKSGYRNPPQSGQFQKGLSGNPRGRPRKRRDEPALPDHRAPTLQEVFRAEINREIPITDHCGRHTITMKQAVTRAMAMTGIKGGVLAQRSFLELTEKEEERHQKEKEENYKYWRDYKKAAEARIAAGEPRPDDPEPDDIKLDWITREVRIEGPINKEHRAVMEVVCAARDVCYEMALYHDEFYHMYGDDGRVVRIGFYSGMYLACQGALWPRMRNPPEKLDVQILVRAVQGLGPWGEDLKARCEALKIPFLPRKKDAAQLMVPLAKLGIKKPIQLPPLRVTPCPRRPRRE